MVTILGIESSCDETAAAICRDGKIISNKIAGQEIHRQYGGVVPELASRAHIQNIVPVVDAALKSANILLSEIDGIAFTRSPGLIGSLLVGTQFAKSLSLSLEIPLIAVNHMQAHVIANLIDDLKPDFPFLCLTVSGGHTQIVQCDSPLDLQLLGETIDDAAGEAFDKSAKLLGLPYPGGPLIDKYAKAGDETKFKFSEPNIAGLNFSFSGLKTSILYFLKDKVKDDPKFIENHLNDLCASIQHTIVRILLKKLKIAALETGIRNICISGGVSANTSLRSEFKKLGEKMKWKTFFPATEYCTDNAAMIAMTGYYKFQAKEFSELSVVPSARSEWNPDN